MIVMCPSFSEADEGGGSDESVVVEREWEDQLRYRIDLDRRRMEIGSDVRVKLTIMPLEKIRVWKIAVFLGGTISVAASSVILNKLAEQVEYLSGFKQVVSKEVPVLFDLWSLRLEDKDGTELQLLPIVSDSSDALLNSPLLPYVTSSDPRFVADPDDSSAPANADAAAELLGPGPWTLAHTMPLPHCDLLAASYTIRQLGLRIKGGRTSR